MDIKTRTSCAKHVLNNAIYILNPFFRLRDEEYHVLLYGAQGIGTWRLHRAYSILLSLCNGRRTVEDIAYMTQMFIKNATQDSRFEAALFQVKRLFFTMSMSRAEQEGKKTTNSIFPSDAPLVSIESFKKNFVENNFSIKEYEAKTFLPLTEDSVSFPPF